MKQYILNKIKYIILLSLCISVFVITGCNAKTRMVNFFSETVFNSVMTRCDLNLKIVDDFVGIGALSESEANTVRTNIDQYKSKLQEKANDKDDAYGELLNELESAISFHKVLPLSAHANGIYTLHITIQDKGAYQLCWYDEGDGLYKSVAKDKDGGWYNVEVGGNQLTVTKPTGVEDSDNGKNMHLSSFSAGNYIAAHMYGNNDNNPSTIEEHDVDPNEPIALFDDPDKEGSMSRKLNEALQAQIYVLNPNIDLKNGSNRLDALIEIVQNATSLEDRTKIVGMLGEYFSPAYELGKDKNGKDKYYEIFLVDNEASNGGSCEDRKKYDMIVKSQENKNGEHSELGWDLSIDQDFGASVYGKEQIIEDMMRLRFIEFNQEAVEKLRGLSDDSRDYFLVNDAKGSWKAFYMVYPLETIEYIKERDDDPDSVYITTKPSGLGINIMTGKYVKYEYLNNSKTSFDYTKYYTLENSDSYYFGLNSSDNNKENPKIPIIFSGYAGNYKIRQVGVNSTHEKTPATTITSRLILTDYLEGTFSPGFVDNENIVAYGRKIRFKMEPSSFVKMDGTNGTTEKKEVWLATKSFITGTEEVEYVNQTELRYNKKEVDGAAFYVDVEGNRIDTIKPLEITDFADVLNAISTSNPKLQSIRVPEMNAEEKAIEIPASEGELTAGTVAKKYVGKGIPIGPVTMFPGKYVGKVDYDNDTTAKQRMYVALVRQGIFDNSLFSDWINSQSQTASLQWWNTYLGENQFSYDVRTEKILSILEDKFAYELSQNGIVILDLDAVAKIQKEYDYDDTLKTTSKIKTFFMILGWITICYSILLMLCWVIDANLDVGVKLLDKVTFGNWVAVKYEEDIPYRNTNDQTFLDQKKMFVRAIILITVGIILININIFNIIMTIIDLFGTAGEKIEAIIKGLR